jgi:hypothetical protein
LLAPAVTAGVRRRGWVNAQALTRACAEHLDTAELERYGISSRVENGTYALHYTVTATEVARTAPNPPLHPDAREQTGVRRSIVERA